MMKLLLLTIFIAVSVAHTITFTETQPHRKDCYSQGLFFLNQTHMFESCGLYGESYFHIMSYSTNPFTIKETFRSVKPYDSNLFFEGAILFKGFIYLITWRQNIVIRFNPTNFQEVDRLKWGKIGWGLTTNSTHMFTTDGSDKMYLVDGQFNLLETKKIVDQTGRKVYNINQLEYVNGYIFANIYLEKRIVKINYEDGIVVDEYDGSKLVAHETGLKRDEVINGIAYSKESKKYILTGKKWSNFYEVEL